MAIVKMKHLRLAAMRSDREALLRLLQRMGCLEIGELSADWGETGQVQPTPETKDRGEMFQRLKASLTAPDAGALAAARETWAQAERALGVLKKYTPEKEGLLQPRPSLREAELWDESVRESAGTAAAEINAAERRISAIRTEQDKLAGQKETLAPWIPLDLPLETESTAQAVIQLGTLPAANSFDQAAQAVEAAGELAQLTQISSDRDQQYCLLICHGSQSKAVLEALKDLGWARANLRDWTGTAAENTARLDRELKALAEELARLEEKLSGMGEFRSALKRLSDMAAAEVGREESRSHMLDTNQAFFLEGWVPAESWPQLEQALAPYPCAAEIADPTPEEYPKVPVKLKNNRLTRPLNMVTEMYSLPAYGSLDPNPLMAPFFILFYGIMMADMGYGLVMFLLGILVLKKKRPGGTMEHLCGLLVLCGISTFIMGALTGGFFGDFIPQLLKMINPESTFELPALFTPLNDTLMVLIGAMCLGLVQIITGMIISLIRKVQNGQMVDALREEVTWWVIFAGIALLALGITSWVLALGGAMLVLGCLSQSIRKGKNPLLSVVLTAASFLMNLVGNLYNNVTGYFGDILSYSRLMALMLAGSVIAQVFNMLGTIPGNVVVFVIIAMVGNTLNFGLNLLSCYVHDLRLQCLEYFNKFYQDGGKPFRPLDMNTKYYNVVK